MHPAEQKNIVIKLPSLSWNFFRSTPFFLFVFSLLFFSSLLYWHQNIRPYLRISSAYLNAFSTTVNTPLAGRIVELGPEEGDRVKKGDILFFLDRDLLTSKKNQAEMILHSLEREIKGEKERLGKAMEAYLIAETERGAENFDLIQKQVSLMEEAQKKSEEASLKWEEIKQEIKQIDLELKKTASAAPFDGIILKRFHNEGAAVSFGEPVYTLCDLDRLWIETEIPENKIAPISIGTPARIRFAAYPNKETAGKISYIGAATVAKNNSSPLSHETPMIPIKISIEHPDPSLKPGLSAQIALKIR